MVSLMIGLVGGTSVGLPQMAYAQTSQPLRLAPPAKKQEKPQPERITPRRSLGDIANPRLRPSTQRKNNRLIEIDSLEAINAEEAGTLTSQTGALGLDMWDGTSRALIEKLLVKLPTRAPSAGMRALMKKLLLSPARVPESEAEGPGIIAPRLNVLMAMGALEDASELLDVLPADRAPELRVVEANLRLLANDTARACSVAESEILNKSTNFWHKILTFCQIIKGEKEKAQLSLLLMRELGDPDEAFIAMAEGLILDKQVDVPTLENPTPLHLAMARVGQVDLPGDVLTANTPSVLRAIAMSPKTSIGMRLEAAERADAAGALPVDALRQLYTSVEFSEEDKANPLSRAEVEFGPMVRALLYHTSLVQTVPTAQAEATARAFALARDEGRYASTVHVFQPVLRRIPPSSQLLWFAPEAVRALLLAGDLQRAENWYQVLQTGALKDQEAARAIDRFRPLARLFEFDVVDPADERVTEAWLSASQDQPDLAAKGTLLFSILQAMDIDVPEQAWEPLISDQARTQVTVANAAVLNRLRSLTEKATMVSRDTTSEADQTRIDLSRSDTDAPNVIGPAPAFDRTLIATEPEPLPEPKSGSLSEPLSEPLANDAPRLVASGTLPLLAPQPVEIERIGETVLLALIAIGENGPANMEVGALSDVLKALSAVGLKEEARRLALEAALTNGL